MLKRLAALFALLLLLGPPVLDAATTDADASTGLSALGDDIALDDPPAVVTKYSLPELLAGPRLPADAPSVAVPFHRAPTLASRAPPRG